MVATLEIVGEERNLGFDSGHTEVAGIATHSINFTFEDFALLSEPAAFR